MNNPDIGINDMNSGLLDISSKLNDSLVNFLDEYKRNKINKVEILKNINSLTSFDSIEKFEMLENYFMKLKHKVKHKELEEKITLQRTKAELLQIRIAEMEDIKSKIAKAICIKEISLNDFNDNKLLNNKRKSLPDNLSKDTKVSQVKMIKKCYICKRNFDEVSDCHFYYSNICRKCGNVNYYYRNISVDLTERIAVLTGGRIKIGYQIGLKLLRSNCKVIVTSRFPKDTLMRYQKEKDYADFKDNLIIYPLDLRFLDSIKAFTQYLTKNYPHLDILINNAAQTLRRPASYYGYLLETETKPLKDEDKIITNSFHQISSNCLDNQSLTIKDKTLPISVLSSQLKLISENESTDLVDGNKIFGADGQPIDFRFDKNSWNLELDEVSLVEFAEVQIINSWGPYFLCENLLPLMKCSPYKDRYIVNVTAVEGIFDHYKKSTHPHTNMAKASLHMYTKSKAKCYKDAGIYMTCVDTGWVTAMNEFSNLIIPTKHYNRSFEEEFLNIPLDEIDGAMRVLHPIAEGVSNMNYFSGILLKDYKQHPW